MYALSDIIFCIFFTLKYAVHYKKCNFHKNVFNYGVLLNIQSIALNLSSMREGGLIGSHSIISFRDFL